VTGKVTCAVEDNNHLPHRALDLSLHPSPASTCASSRFDWSSFDRRPFICHKQRDDPVQLLRYVYHQIERDPGRPVALLFYGVRPK